MGPLGTPVHLLLSTYPCVVTQRLNLIGNQCFYAIHNSPHLYSTVPPMPLPHSSTLGRAMIHHAINNTPQIKSWQA